MSDPSLVFVQVYPKEEVEVVKDEAAFARTFAFPGDIDTLERYSCVLEVNDGESRKDADKLHSWSYNSAFQDDPALRPLTALYDQKSAVAIFTAHKGNNAATISISSVTRATASRHYFFRRIAGQPAIQPLAAFTVLPEVSTMVHNIAAGLPFYINVPFLYAQLAQDRVVGPSIVARSPESEVFHWTQYRRPDPDVMSAGLRALNAALSLLVEQAKSRGSLIRALGEPKGVLNGEMADQVTCMLLGASYDQDPSNAMALQQVLLLNKKPYNTTDPLAPDFNFKVLESWPAVYKRILSAIRGKNPDAAKAAECLARDAYLDVLSTYTGSTAVRQLGERVRANAFTIKRASEATVGVYHCYLVNPNEDSAVKLRLRLGTNVPLGAIRAYSLVAAFGVNVIAPAEQDPSRPETAAANPVARAQYITLDPSSDFSTQLRILPDLTAASYANSSRTSKVAWHVLPIQRQPLVRVKAQNSINSLVTELLWPMTKAFAEGGETAAFGVPFVDTASARVPLYLPTNEILEYAKTRNGGNYNRPVQFALLAFLQEGSDPLGLEENPLGYAALGKPPGDLNGGIVALRALSNAEKKVGIRVNPFVARPMVGLVLVNVEIVSRRLDADTALESARDLFVLPKAIADRVRDSIATINSNRDTYEQTIKDVLRYRLDCINYVQSVLLADDEKNSVYEIGKLFGDLVDKQLVPYAGDSRVMVWQESGVVPPFPDTEENLGRLADREPKNAGKRADTVTWLERLVKAQGGEKVADSMRNTWEIDRDRLTIAFLQDPRNRAICVAMVDEQRRIDNVKLELEKFSSVPYLLASVKNVVDVLNEVGLSATLDRSGAIAEALKATPQMDTEDDDDYGYRRDLGTELESKLARLDDIRRRFFGSSDHSASTLTLSTVEENVDALLKSNGRYNVTAYEVKALRNTTRAASPRPTTILRQAASSISTALKEFLTGKLKNAAATLSIVNTYKGRKAKAAATTKKGRAAKPGLPSSALAGLAFAQSKQQQQQQSGKTLEKVYELAYQLASAAEAQVIALIATKRAEVDQELAFQKRFIEVLAEVSSRRNAIVENYTAQVQLFEVTVSESFADLARTEYELKVDGDRQPPIRVSLPVFLATKQYLEQRSQKKPETPIVDAAKSVVNQRADELKRLYTAKLSPEAGRATLTQLEDIVRGVVSGNRATTFDDLFKKDDIDYGRFVTEVRDKVFKFAQETGSLAERVNNTIGNVSARIGGADPGLAQNGVMLINRLTDPLTGGILQRVTKIGQTFAAIIDTIIKSATAFVLVAARADKTKTPFELLRAIADGIKTNRDKDYVALRQVNDELEILAGVVTKAERDAQEYENKVKGGVLSVPLIDSERQLVLAVENHKAYFGKLSGPMAETYSQFVATREKAIATYFIMDAWTSPEALRQVENWVRNDLGVTWAMDTSPDPWPRLIAASLALSADARKALFSRILSKQQLLLDLILDGARGQFNPVTVNQKRANASDECAKLADSCSIAFSAMLSESVSAELKTRLYADGNLAAQYPRPDALVEVIKRDIVPLVKARLGTRYRQIQFEYLDGLDRVTRNFMGESFLWHSAGPRIDAASFKKPYTFPFQGALEALVGWRTGAITALEEQIQANLKTPSFSLSRLIGGTEESLEHLPLQGVIPSAIRLGKLNVADRLFSMTQADDGATIRSPTTTRAVFAVYVHGTLSAFDAAVKYVIDNADTTTVLLGINPQDESIAFLYDLLQAWLDGTDGADLISRRNPAQPAGTDVAKDLYGLFSGHFEEQLDVYLSGTDFDRRRKLAGWNTIDPSEKLHGDMKTESKIACRFWLTEEGSRQALSAVMALFGATPSHTLLIDEFNVLNITTNTLNLLHGADRGALLEKDSPLLWSVIKAGDKSRANAAQAFIPMANVFNVAVSELLNVTVDRDDAAERNWITDVTYVCISSAIGKIQERADEIKARIPTGAAILLQQQTREKAIDSLQKLVDQLAFEAYRYYQPTNSMVMGEPIEKVFVRLTTLLQELPIFEADALDKLQKAEAKIVDHLKNVAAAAAASAALTSPPVPVAKAGVKRRVIPRG